MELPVQIVDYDKLEAAGKLILEAIGEDPNREALTETPARFARYWREFIQFDPGKVDTVFESTTSNQMVVVSGMRLWSLCEHHLLPFYCDLSIGYIPDGKILGLSKFGRVAQYAAHRLQVQERLVSDVAGLITEMLGGNPDIAVLAQGEHLCMTMRGIRMPSLMTSNYLGGAFHSNPQTRAEFMSIATTRSNTYR